MALCIFDLDHTLLEGDCDQLWGDFLAQKGIVDPVDYQTRKQRFLEDYQAGCLDILEFYRFVLAPLKPFSMSELIQLRHQFSKRMVSHLIRPKAEALIHTHKQKGDYCLLITATNAFVAQAAMDLLDVHEMIATEPEIREDRLTGGITGTPVFREGKVERLQLWLSNKPYDLETATCYSDSHNDIPLLSLVGHPVAVTPDERLREWALQHHWKIINLSSNPA